MSEDIVVSGIKFDSRDMERAIERAERRLNALENEVDDVARAAKKAEGAFDGTAKKVLQLAAAYGVFATANKAARFIFDSNVEFQRLESTLQTVTGSVQRGAAAFDMITTFAAETPFEVKGVTDAFIALRVRGVEPTVERMRGLGNFASAFSKDITGLTDAVASAVAGNTETLRAMGVGAKREGDLIKMSFNGISKTIQADAENISAFLAEIGNTQFAGAMADRMNTLEGKISLLKDSSALLARTIGQQGLNASIGELVDTLDAAVQSGDDFAKTLGSTLASGVRIADGALEAFIDHLDVIQTAFGVLAGAAIARGLGIMAIRMAAAATAASGLGAAMLALAGGPYLAAATAIGGLVALGLATRNTGDDAVDASVAFDTFAESVKKLDETSTLAALAKMRAELLAISKEAKKPLPQPVIGPARSAVVAPSRMGSGEAAPSRLQTSMVTAPSAMGRTDPTPVMDPRITVLAAQIQAAEQHLSRLEDASTRAATDRIKELTEAEFKLGEAIREQVGESEKAISEEAARHNESAIKAEDAIRARIDQEHMLMDAREQGGAVALRTLQEEIAAYNAVAGVSLERAFALAEELRLLDERKKVTESADMVAARVNALHAETDLIVREAEARAMGTAAVQRLQVEMAGELAVREAINEATSHGIALKDQDIEKIRLAAEERARASEAARASDQSMDAMDGLKQSLHDNIVDGLTDVITASGEAGDAFANMIKQMERELVRFGMNKFLNELLGAIASAAGSSGGSAAASGYTPMVVSQPQFRARGGPVTDGSAYVVGELGPEVFVPRGNGSIIPNNRLGGGAGQTVHVHQAITFHLASLDPRAHGELLEGQAGTLMKIMDDAVQNNSMFRQRIRGSR